MVMDNKPLIIAIGIFLVGMIITVIVSDKVRGYSMDIAHVYNTSIIIDDTELLDYAMETSQGVVITGGIFEAIQPVNFPEMNDRYMIVHRTTQEYRRHTRTVTDSDGRTRTEVYWTWDNVGYKTISSKTLKFRGKEYMVDIFKFPSYNLSGYHYVHSHMRYDYDVVDIKTSGNFIAKAQNNTLTDAFGNGRINIQHKSYEKIKKYGEWVELKNIILLWVASIVLFGGLSFISYHKLREIRSYK